MRLQHFQQAAARLRVERLSGAAYIDLQGGTACFRQDFHTRFGRSTFDRLVTTVPQQSGKARYRASRARKTCEMHVDAEQIEDAPRAGGQQRLLMRFFSADQL